jgi:hypothetical protein
MDSSTQPHYYPGANLARPSRLRKAQKNQCRYLMTDAGNPAATPLRRHLAATVLFAEASIIAYPSLAKEAL